MPSGTAHQWTWTAKLKDGRIVQVTAATGAKELPEIENAIRMRVFIEPEYSVIDQACASFTVRLRDVMCFYLGDSTFIINPNAVFLIS